MAARRRAGRRGALLLVLLILPLSGCTATFGAQQTPLEPAERPTPTPATPPGAEPTPMRDAGPIGIDVACEHRRCELRARPVGDAGAPRFVSYVWSLDDGRTLVGDHVTHLFSEPGAHRVALSGKTAGGTVHAVEETFRVEAAGNERPVARISWRCDGLDCRFDGTASEDVEDNLTSWNWDLGDGWRFAHPELGHEYVRGGRYRVTLTVTDGANLTDTATAVIEVVGPPPPPPPDNGTGDGTAAPPGDRPPERPPSAAPPPPTGPAGHDAATGGSPACRGASVTNESDDVQARSYTWSYRGRNWTWAPAIPDAWWHDYVSRARPMQWQDFAILAADAGDDAVLDEFACLVRTTAAAEGFSEYETLEFVVAFVRSLRYNDDRAGAGFDEYPKFPLETLIDQEGDCEDTSVLLAALVDAIGYDAVLLVFEGIDAVNGTGHAAVGIAAPGLTGTYWQHQGRSYHYVETTASYTGIGQVPDVVDGARAHVLPVVARPLLGELWWSAPAWDDDAYRYEIEVANIGTAPLENLTLWAGWDAGGGRAWDGTQVESPEPLPAGERRVVTLRLPAPPSDTSTRMWLTAWGDRAPSVETFSAWFDT